MGWWAGWLQVVDEGNFFEVMPNFAKVGRHGG